MNTSTKLGVMVLTLVLVGTALPAQPLQRKLDKPVRLNLRNTPLPAVFEALKRQTDVPFEINYDTYRALPYGEDTRLDVTLPGQSLRDTLTKMLVGGII